jgi:hypothetical protein
MRQIVLQCHLFVHVFGNDADPAAHDAAVREDFLHHAAHQIHRNGDADALGAHLLTEHRGVDAHELATRVDQRATGVADVDGRIGLDEAFVRRDAELRTARRADDAVRHRLREPERIADRQHRIADLQRVGTAELHHRQILECDLQHREIGVRIAPHHFGVRAATVGELHPDLIGLRHHVMIGDDVALPIDDDSRTERILHTLPIARLRRVAEELFQPEAREPLGHDADRVDVHDGR